jgi:hypothetical protein
MFIYLAFSFTNCPSFSAISALAKTRLVQHEAGMALPPMPRWFKFLTILGSISSVILIGKDQEEPERIPDSRSLAVIATPIKVPRSNVDIPTSLSLRLTNAWSLYSANSEFGGLSALYASGDALTFISDRGALTRLGRDRQSRNWSGVIGPLPPACGDMIKKVNRDTESLAVDPRTGTMWIGFEHINRFCRIAARDQGGSRNFALPQMKSWWKTGGPEAMVRLKSGAFLIFQEVPRPDGPIGELLHVDRDPALASARITKMRYRPPTGFRPVDAAELPDGRLLVLNRRFQLPFTFSSRISIISLPAIKEGTLFTGPIVARIEGEGIGENYEALAIDNDGQDLAIWVASDNNFLSIQRTLLLRFVWPGAAKASALR